MLGDAQIAKEENLNFRSSMHNAGKYHVFDEVTSGTFMRDAEIVSGAYPNYEYEILLISLYADAANPDFRRRAALSPIVVQCLNFIGKICRMDVGKKVISFFPKLKVCEKYL